MKDSSARDGFDQWCGDMRRAGIRRLSREERAGLEDALRRAAAMHRVRATVSRVVEVGVLGMPIGFMIWNPNGADLVLTAFAALGVALLAFAGLGALYVALVGPQMWARWAARVSVLLLLAGALWPGPTEVQVSLLVIGGWGAVACGVIWAFERWTLRALGPAFDVAGDDLGAGNVVVFRGDGESEVLELLPRSQLWLDSRGWGIAHVSEVAAVPDPPEGGWPLWDAAREANPAAGVHRRPLSPQEQDELRETQRPESLPSTLWAALGAAFVVHGVWRFIVGDGPTAAAAWALVGIGLLWVQVRTLRGEGRLARDIADAVVERTEFPPGQEPRVEERLPASGLDWTCDGMPAQWRLTDRAAP